MAEQENPTDGATNGSSLKGEDKEEKGEDKEEEEKGDDDNKHSNALVIRDGFPALLLRTSPNNNKTKWWMEETDKTMKLPRWPFWAHDNALLYPSEARLSSLVSDCHKVFTARTLEDNAAYSAGTTYFLPAPMKPRCALEGLVQLIFQQHVKLLPPEITYRPDQSGAEWWTLVLKPSSSSSSSNDPKSEKQCEEDEEEEDDVGWHFDADYGLEDQAPGLLLHPRVATVTYLSHGGAPTVVTDCGTPQQGNVQHLNGKSISQAWVSYPKVGKHMAFDGRLLHGAPSDVFPSLAKGRSKDGANHHPAEEPPTKRSKVDDTATSTTKAQEDDKQQQSQERVTLLVNVWLNHCPLDAELLDDDIVQQMETPWDDATIQPSELFAWNDQEADMTQESKLPRAEIVPAPNQEKAASQEEELEDEIVLCNHQVLVKYGATMEDYHSVAQALVKDTGPAATTVLVQLGKGAITLHVGDPLPPETEAEDAEGDE